jgi:hypothetical protein
MSAPEAPAPKKPFPIKISIHGNEDKMISRISVSDKNLEGIISGDIILAIDVSGSMSGFANIDNAIPTPIAGIPQPVTGIPPPPAAAMSPPVAGIPPLPPARTLSRTLTSSMYSAAPCGYDPSRFVSRRSTISRTRSTYCKGTGNSKADILVRAVQKFIDSLKRVGGDATLTIITFDNIATICEPSYVHVTDIAAMDHLRSEIPTLFTPRSATNILAAMRCISTCCRPGRTPLIMFASDGFDTYTVHQVFGAIGKGNEQILKELDESMRQHTIAIGIGRPYSAEITDASPIRDGYFDAELLEQIGRKDYGFTYGQTGTEIFDNMLTLAFGMTVKIPKVRICFPDIPESVVVHCSETTHTAQIVDVENLSLGQTVMICHTIPHIERLVGIHVKIDVQLSDGSICQCEQAIMVEDSSSEWNEEIVLKYIRHMNAIERLLKTPNDDQKKQAEFAKRIVVAMQTLPVEMRETEIGKLWTTSMMQMETYLSKIQGEEETDLRFLSSHTATQMYSSPVTKLARVYSGCPLPSAPVHLGHIATSGGCIPGVDPAPIASKLFTCVVCQDKVTSVFLECQHMPFCAECFETAKAHWATGHAKTCPICRTEIDETKIIEGIIVPETRGVMLCDCRLKQMQVVHKLCKHLSCCTKCALIRPCKHCADPNIIDISDTLIVKAI